MWILRVTGSSQTLTLRSSARMMTASRRTTEAPPRRSSRRGRISERPRHPKFPIVPLLLRLIASPFWEVLRQFTGRFVTAGDSFDSDCVVGTQFESSQLHHAVLCKQRFPAPSRNKIAVSVWLIGGYLPTLRGQP